MSLRSRILVGCTLLVVASCYCIMSLVMNDVRPRYLESVEESMVDTAELAAAMVSALINGDGMPVETVSAAMRELALRRFDARIFNAEKKHVSLQVYITDKQGILVYDSTGKFTPGADFSQWRDVYLTLRGRYGARSTRTDRKDPASSVLYVAAPIMKAGEIFGVVTVGKPQDSVSFFIDIARDRLRLTLLLIGASAVGIAVLMSFWVTWPLKRLTRYVRSVREGRPEPLPALGSPEIRLLGESIGEMQSRLEGKNYIEDYIRALTHEMKSPLTGIRGAAEILRDLSDDGRSLRFIDNIDSESRRMQDLVERMLQLSRLENVRSITRQGIEAGLFFHELAGSLQARLDEKSQTLRLAVQESLLLQADPFLLRLAVNNLLVNAMDFAPSGSTITLTASGCPEHGEERVFRHGAEISVRDEGPGIPDFALPKVFDKFFSLARPDTGKKSSGLGLPFVREVAALHGGRVLLSNRSPGLEARLLLPGA